MTYTDEFDTWGQDPDVLDARADADEDTAQAFAAYAERVSEQASVRYADALAYLNRTTTHPGDARV